MNKKRISESIISYLNFATKKHGSRGFRPTATNLRFIISRLNEGYSEADLIYVIDNKVTQWLNCDKMRMYLRPATLFNATKFNQYIAEEKADEKTGDHGDSNKRAEISSGINARGLAAAAELGGFFDDEIL